MKKLLKSFLFTTLVSSAMSLETEIGVHFDNNQSPLSGSRNIASLTSLGSSVFNKYLPNNILGRLGMAYCQEACIFLFFTFNHEYYGHGSTFKNIGIGLDRIKIKFSSFGFPGGGWSLPKRRADNIDDSILVSISGSQANTYHSQQQILNNFHKDKIDFFLLNTIFSSNIEVIMYLTAGSIPNFDENKYGGHDIIKWRDNLASKYDKDVLTIGDLYNSLIPLISSTTFMMLNGMYNYFIHGENFNEWLCFKSGDFKYLPNFRTEATPFGLAYALDNFFAHNERTFLFSFSGLNDPSERFVFTFDLRTNNLFTSQFVDFDLRSVFARQPFEEVSEIFFGIEDKGTFFGYMIQPSLKLKLNNFKIYLDYTMKNSIFIPAAPYREGHYFNIGLSYNFDL